MLGEKWRRGERGVGLMKVSVILQCLFIGTEVAEVRDSLVERTGGTYRVTCIIIGFD